MTPSKRTSGELDIIMPKQKLQKELHYLHHLVDTGS